MSSPSAPRSAGKVIPGALLLRRWASCQGSRLPIVGAGAAALIASVPGQLAAGAARSLALGSAGTSARCASARLSRCLPVPGRRPWAGLLRGACRARGAVGADACRAADASVFLGGVASITETPLCVLTRIAQTFECDAHLPGLAHLVSDASWTGEASGHHEDAGVEYTIQRLRRL